MSKLKRLVDQHRIIAILRGVPCENTLDYVRAAYEGGVRLFEIALNSERALEQIASVRERYGDKLHVGAGTVLSEKQAEEAIRAGAEFLLTPCTDKEMLDFCRENSVELLPGVMTPSDIGICFRSGFRLLKLFPAGDLPAGYIKSLKGPFADVDFVAVGGVSRDNVRHFLKQGFVGAGIGSNLIPREFIRENRWDEAAAGVAGIVRQAVPEQGGKAR